MRRFALPVLAALPTVLLALAACAPPPEPPDNSARFKVLGAVDSYDREGWRVVGAQAVVEARTEALPFQGVPALRVVPGPLPYAFVRRTHSRLWVTPFLSWSWFLSYGATARPPVRVVVGFNGARARGTLAAPDLADLPLPEHDRRLELVWDQSALRRGSLDPATAGAGARTYAVRGGRENAGTWWLETIDLAALYRRAWPADDPGRADIAFYAIVGGAAGPKGDDAPGNKDDDAPSAKGAEATAGAVAYLSGFFLSR